MFILDLKLYKNIYAKVKPINKYALILIDADSDIKKAVIKILLVFISLNLIFEYSFNT